MKHILLSCFFLLPAFASAQVPVMVVQETPKDVTVIEDAELREIFYGQMTGFPHTFEIRSSHPFILSVKLFLPDIPESKDNIGAIIIKERSGGGRVEEQGRLSEKGPWPTQFKISEGNTYRVGPSFEKEVPPGIYRIEVHTGDNIEKYVLEVGTREEMTLGYFEQIGRLMDIKAFFGKPRISAVTAPLVYVPLMVLAVFLIGFWAWKRKRMKAVI